MFDKILSFLNKILTIIDFPGSSYLNLWSLILLIISAWVCIKTRTIPMPVATIFASIVTAYSANSISQNIFGIGKIKDQNKETKSNDSNNNPSNPK
jgi:hypothetical protein